MKSSFIGCLFYFFISFALAEDSVSDLFKQNREQIFASDFCCISQTFFAVGTAKIKGDSSIASDHAVLEAESKIISYLQKQISVTDQPSYISDDVMQLVLSDFFNKSHPEYVLNNVRRLWTRVINKEIRIVIGIKKRDIISPFSDTIPWQEIYNAYKMLPNKNLFLYCEMLDEQEFIKQLPEIEEQMSKIYGLAFSHIFCGKEVVQTNTPENNEQRLFMSSITVKAPMPMIIKTINSVGYEPNIIKILSDKFCEYKMLRCAKQMENAYQIALTKSKQESLNNSTIRSEIQGK